MTRSPYPPHSVAGLNDVAGWSALACGKQHVLAVDSDGTVWAWGWNDFGALGDGTDTDHYTPTAIRAAETWLDAVGSVAVGELHTLALCVDGTIQSWGSNTNGQLGDGTTIDHLQPRVVADITSGMAVAVGGNHSLALLADGTVWAWGENAFGELGDDSPERHVPGPVPDLTNVVAVAAGAVYSLALLGDGTISAWGGNLNGQLGDGSSTKRSSPGLVSNLTNIVALAAGEYAHNLALKQDGTVWAWGFNETGQLGDNSILDRHLPVPVLGLTNVVAVACGKYHSMALKSDGTVWAWGFNKTGQLGDGTISDRHTPVQVLGLPNVVAIAAGKGHSLARTADGEIWAWGANDQGQAGVDDHQRLFGYSP